MFCVNDERVAAALRANSNRMTMSNGQKVFVLLSDHHPTTSLLLLPPSAFFHRLSDLMLILPFWFCSQLILIVAPCRELPTPDITPDIDQKLRACCIFPLLTFLLFLFLFGYLPSVSARTSFCIGHYYNSIPVSTVSIYSQRQQIVTPSLKMIT